MSKSRIEIVPVGAKFHVIVDNSDVPSHKAGTQAAAQITVDRIIKQFGAEKIVQVGLGSNVTLQGGDGEDLMGVAEFDINERFLFLEHFVSMVARGKANSVVIVGQGGLGKTHTVIETLHKMGLDDIDEMVAKAEIGSSVAREGTYKFVSGYSTAKGLYRTLFENNNCILVFDDCDSIQKDPNALNILKAALDTYSKRIISWNSEPIGGSDLPTSFQFDGRIVFISNLPLRTWDTAVKSRAMTVDVHMTRSQIIDRMRHMVDNDQFMPEFQMDHKLDALNTLDKLKDIVKDLNLRTLIKAVQTRADAPDEIWESMLTYLVTN